MSDIKIDGKEILKEFKEMYPFVMDYTSIALMGYGSEYSEDDTPGITLIFDDEVDAKSFCEEIDFTTWQRGPIYVIVAE